MIFVPRRFPMDMAGWKAWRRSCHSKQKALNASLGQLAVDGTERGYRGADLFLKEIFFRKCAYCESVIETTHTGATEHYRPKGRVSDIDFKPVKVIVKGIERAHPGYYWHAYDWKNLLPICWDCNSRRGHGKAKAIAGKHDRFPVAGLYAISRAAERAEQPLLLDPTIDCPEEHLAFAASGEIQPLTNRGQITCQVLGLNVRRDLVENRADMYQRGHDEFGRVTRAYDEVDFERQRCNMNALWAGRRPYTAFARAGIEDAIEKINSQLGAELKMPLPCPGQYCKASNTLLAATQPDCLVAHALGSRPRIDTPVVAQPA